MRKIIVAKKIIKSLLIVCLLALMLLLGYQNWYIFTQNKWQPKNYTKQSISAIVEPPERTKIEIKALIEDVFDIPHLYFEQDFSNQSVWGRAIPQINAVFIDKNIDGVLYAEALAHELSHCKYQSVNECYTEYMAIITLIESKYEYTKCVGYHWANQITNGYRYDDEYDCGYYILEYLKDKGEIL